MNDIKTKLTSRKFLLAVTGVISGVVLLINGQTTEGVATIISSVVAYLIAEGIIDAAAVKATADKVGDTIILEGLLEDEAEETEENISSAEE